MRRLSPYVAMLACVGCVQGAGFDSLPESLPQGDVEPPSISEVEITPRAAADGTVVTIAFTVSEPLAPLNAEGGANPEVTFGGKRMTCDSDANTFSCTYRVGAEIAEGPTGFRVRAMDRAGNSTEQSPLTRVVVDRTPPEVLVETPFGKVAAGGRVNFGGTLDDANPPAAARVTASFLPTPLGCPVVEGRFTCGLDLPEGTPLGAAVFQVTAKDLAGNLGDSGPRTVTVEASNVARAPVVTFQSVSPNPAKRDSVLTIKFRSDQALAAADGCKAVVNSTRLATCASGDGPGGPSTQCTCTFTVTADIADGDIPVSVTGKGANGLVSVADLGTVQIDTFAPVIKTTSLVVVRRAFGADDALQGAAGAVRDELGATYTSPTALPKGVSRVRFFDGSGPTATELLPGGLVPAADGSVALVSLSGTDGAPGRLSPASVFASATDAAGNESARVLLDGSAVSPALLTANVTVARRDFTAADGLTGLAGAYTGACRARVSLFDVQTGGTALNAVPVELAADGSFPEIRFGTAQSAPPRVFGELTDKCGQTGPRTMLTSAMAPAVIGGKTTVARRDFTAADGVTGSAGAVVTSCRAKVTLWDAATGGTALNSTPVDALADGSFAELLVGTAQAAPAKIFADATDKCGQTGTRAQLSNPAVPVLAGYKVTVTRRDFSAADGAAGGAGAVTTSCRAKVTLFDAATGGTALNPTAVEVQADGSFAEIAAGTAQSAPAKLWGEPTDKCGQTGLRVQLANAAAPALTGSKVTVTRRDFSTADGVTGGAGAAVMTCRAKVTLYDAATAGNALNATPVEALADGSFPEIAVGTAQSAPASIYGELTDKCGATSARVQVGTTGSAPGVVAANVKISRRGFSAIDGVSGLAGAIAMSCRAKFTLYDAATGGAALNAAPVEAAADGSFAEVPVGTVDAAPGPIFAEATDKCGRTGTRTEITPTAARNAPYVYSSVVTVNRRNFGELDSVVGAKGAVFSHCAFKVSLYDLPTGGTVLNQPPLEGGLDGSFAELTVGTTTSAPSTIYFSATDKCGHTTLTRTSLTNTGDPAIATPKMTLVRRGMGDLDGVVGAAGAATGNPCRPKLRFYDVSTATTPIAVADSVQADGSFGEVPVGTGTLAPKSVWVDAVDKCGRSTGGKSEIAAGKITTAPTVDGSKISIVRKGFGVPDEVVGLAGAVTGGNAFYVTIRDGSATGPVMGTADGDFTAPGTPTPGSFRSTPFGTAIDSAQSVYVFATNKVGISSTSTVKAMGGGDDFTAPTLTQSKFTIVRRDYTAADSVTSADAAVADDNSVARVILRDAQYGNTLATALPTAASGIVEATVGTATLAPAHVWAVAVDKAGNASASVQISAGNSNGPAATAGFRFIRRDLTAPDSIIGDPGGITGACYFAGTGTYYDSTDTTTATTPRGTVVVNADGSVEELAFGTATSAPPLMALSVTNKCAQTARLLPAQRETAGSAAVLDATKLVILRYDASQTDEVAGLAGALKSKVCWPTVLNIYPAYSPPAAISVPFVVKADNSIDPVPLTGLTPSPMSVWVAVQTKCMNEGIKTEPMGGGRTTSSFSPTADPTKIQIVRRDLTQRDSVVGTAAAFTGPCVFTTVNLYSSPAQWAPPVLATGAAANDQSFEIPVGTTTSAPARVWIGGTNKCGQNLPYGYTEVPTGADTTPPVVDGSKITYTLRMDGTAESAFADADAVKDPPNNFVREVKAANTVVALAADGSFPLTSLGEIDYGKLPITATDKCGNVATGTAKRIDALLTGRNDGGGTIYQGGAPNGFGLFDFSSRVDPLTVKPGYAAARTLEYGSASSYISAIDTQALLSVAGPLAAPTPGWTLLAPTTKPAPRAGAALGVSFNGPLVAGGFGGTPSSPTVLTDSFGWNYSSPPSWVSRSTTSPPVGMSGQPATFDQTFGALLTLEATTGKTMGFDGWSSTSLYSIAAVPELQRTKYAIATDPTSGTTYVFGGVVAGTVRGDTWALKVEGTSRVWRQVSSSGPGPRTDHAMAFDAGRGALVLFGGLDATGAPLADTWEFDGTTWTQITTTYVPAARSRHAMAYDVATRQVAMFGGAEAGTGAQLLTYDGTNWALVSASPGPSARASPAFAAVRTPSELMAFGGETSGGYSDETWVYESGAATAQYASHLIYFSLPTNATIASLTARWVGGGRGANGTVLTNGAQLAMFDPASGWRHLAEHDKLDSEPDVTLRTLTITPTSPPATYLAGDRIWLLAKAKYPSSAPGATTINSELRTNYVELRATYTVP